MNINQVKNYVMIGLLVVIVILCCLNYCNKSTIKQGKEIIISNTIDTVTINKTDTLWKEIVKTKILYKDKKVLQDSSVKNYTNVEEDSIIKITVYTSLIGELGLVQLDYKLKYLVIKDSTKVIVTNTITKLRVDTVKVKQSLLYIGTQVQYNPITLKADIGPTVLLNLKKIKIGYTYNIIGRTHQGLVVFPIKF